MTTKITFACPYCSTKLKGADRSRLAQKVKCPKCQKRFQPKPLEGDLNFDDEPSLPTPT